MAIHPTAVIDPNATLGKDVQIGPYCVVGAHVTLGDGVQLMSHVVVEGRTTIGEGTRVFPFASLGHIPQDLKFKGEPSTLSIGKRNQIREHVTMNPGTEGGGMETVVGDDCLFMMGAHVAHDCHVGNRVVLANNATLAGHVTVGDNVVIGGLSAIHQFVRIGRNAMIGGMSGIEGDVIPYGMAFGERAALTGLNIVGLKRRGFDREQIHTLRGVFREIFEGKEGTFSERVEAAKKEHGAIEVVADIIDFITGDTSRSFCQPKHNAA